MQVEGRRRLTPSLPRTQPEAIAALEAEGQAYSPMPRPSAAQLRANANARGEITASQESQVAESKAAAQRRRAEKEQSLV